MRRLLLAAVAAAALPTLALAQTATICVDAGHGGYDPGAVGNGLEESALNLDAALAFADWMDADTADNGGGGSWTVLMTRDTDVYVGLTERCDYANSNGADYFMSIHTNAGGGNGTETYAYSAGGVADDLAHEVQAEVLDHLGTYDRGVKYASFTVLTNTSMPADLAEMAFIDVWAGNAELLSDPANLDEVGHGHLHAIQQHMGLDAYTPGGGPVEEPTASIEITAWPAQVALDVPFDITVEYETDLWEFGEVGQLIAEIKDFDTWEVLHQTVWDNGGAGVQGPAGSHVFEFEVPEDTPQVYFMAFLTPLGGGWSNRYAHTSTFDDPTDVVEGDSDLDGDGYTVADGDCDDEDADVHPGAPDDDCDGVDDDCDGVVDDPDACGDDDTGDDDDDMTGDDDDDSMPPPRPPNADGDDESGCGCRTAGPLRRGSSVIGGLVMLLVVLRSGTRRRSH
jgi:N-acetylmuramoyl-L-alanine amidase